MRFLHVGCGPARPFTAPCFRGEWQEVRLDIDPGVQPDLLASITDMRCVADSGFDGLFSSHNLEHLYPHEVIIALKEFRRVLKPDGFAVITVPDLQAVCAQVAENRLAETAYLSQAGPIAPLDMLYGFRPALAAGNLYMAHRCGFTLSLLVASLREAGFPSYFGLRRPQAFDLWVLAHASALSDTALRELARLHLP
ncbi:MAG: methyltransferase domain-containing protein [Magnetococcales bacterium]|nr:methyltransferase domain-containing protein [Magnetococcales bacterium]